MVKALIVRRGAVYIFFQAFQIFLKSYSSNIIYSCLVCGYYQIKLLFSLPYYMVFILIIILIININLSYPIYLVVQYVYFQFKCKILIDFNLKLQLKSYLYIFKITRIMQGELQQLIAKKDEMEKKLAQIEEQLKKMDQNYHLQKGTVDSEGFPRADLDFGQLTNYRNLKRTKAQLNNDHLQIMKQIEKMLFQLHKNLPEVEGQQQVFPNKQQKKAAQKAEAKKEVQKQQQKPHNIDYLTPFAKISFVNPDSPACKAGVKVQDLVSQLSDVNIYTIDPMKQIPKHVREGIPLKLVVLRPLQGEEKGQGIFQLKDNKYYKKTTIQLVPSMWAGRGILGCKIDPLI